MKNIFYHPLMVIVITILAGVFLLSLNRNTKGLNTAVENIRSSEEEIAKSKDDIEEMGQQLQVVESEVYVDRVFRNEFLVQKSGERIIQIADQNGDFNQNDEFEEIEEKPIDQWKIVFGL
jgi:cell division protein FtsL